MEKSVFNTDYQEKNLTSKIVVGLERVSEAFKYLLWDHAKTIGISPIQIQILIFIANHKRELCSVSYLAKEFNITKPTVSDAVKVLVNKKLIIKDFSNTDSRSYTIVLSKSGKDLVLEIDKFANPIKSPLESFNQSELEVLYTTINKLIYSLNKVGIIQVQRTCYGCKFYEQNKGKHYCNFLNKQLNNNEIRLDCAEYEDAS